MATKLGEYEYSVDNVLGQGQFGIVYLGTHSQVSNVLDASVFSSIFRANENNFNYIFIFSHLRSNLHKSF